jgi:hypothetical protein
MAKPERPTKAAKDDVAPDLAPEAPTTEDAVPPVEAPEPTRHGSEGADPAPEAATDHGAEGGSNAPAEDKAETPAEEVTDPPQTPAPAASPLREVRVERKGGFLPMVAGGVLAAAAGYGVATYFTVLPQQTPAPELLATLQTRLAELEARPNPAAGLAEQLSALEARVAEIPPPAPAPDLSGITTSLADLGARIDGLEARFAALEATPADATGAPSAALAATVEALRRDIEGLKSANAAASEEIKAMAAEAEAKLAAAEAEAEQAHAESAAALQAAARKSAVGRIQAALESGGGFSDALAGLEGLDVPAALSDMAEKGVPTRADLAQEFPPAARVALEASVRATMGNSLGERVSAFLRTTTGARSLAPREGADPDAVLSRAEAAVKAGDLPAALAEISALPEPGQAAMADWVEQARKRLAAEEATAALAASVEG